MSRTNYLRIIFPFGPSVLFPCVKGPDRFMPAIRRFRDVEIRRAARQDLAMLEEIERSSFQKERFPRSLLSTITSSEGFLTFVAEEEGGIVGYSSAYLEGRGRARLISIAVLPRERGKGTAKLLLTRLEGGCAHKGVAVVGLEVAVSNVVALRLYFSQGYAIKGMIRDYYGKGKDAFYMVKRLR